jgi:hypothetical protein
MKKTATHDRICCEYTGVQHRRFVVRPRVGHNLPAGVLPESLLRSGALLSYAAVLVRPYAQPAPRRHAPRTAKRSILLAAIDGRCLCRVPGCLQFSIATTRHSFSATCRAWGTRAKSTRRRTLPLCGQRTPRQPDGDCQASSRLSGTAARERRALRGEQLRLACHDVGWPAYAAERPQTTR